MTSLPMEHVKLLSTKKIRILMVSFPNMTNTRKFHVNLPASMISVESTLKMAVIRNPESSLKHVRQSLVQAFPYGRLTCWLLFVPTESINQQERNQRLTISTSSLEGLRHVGKLICLICSPCLMVLSTGSSATLITESN